MMRKVITLAAAADIALGPVAIAHAADPVPTGTVANGIAWTTHAQPPPNSLQIKGLGDYCTLSAVGTDSGGRKVAFSAAHCVSEEKDGAIVYRYATNAAGRTPIGKIAYRNADIDYAVIQLNDDAVLKSQGPGPKLDSIGSDKPTGTLSKFGQTTGTSQGPLTGVEPTRIYNVSLAGPGDSGGPAYQGTAWTGMTRALNTNPEDIVRLRIIEFVKATAVLADVQAQANPVGKGFTITK